MPPRFRAFADLNSNPPGPARPALLRLSLAAVVTLAVAQTQGIAEAAAESDKATTPKVVVSVLPVHSLASALMRGVGDAHLLVQPGQSPHGGALKPSQIRMLNSADLIIWVGPALERALEKTIANARQARVITLMENTEITLLPGRRGGVWAWHEHEHGHAQERAPTRAGTPRDWRADPHLWLSVANARAIVRIVARALADLDHANRDRYASNARDLLTRLTRLRQTLRARLRAVDSPYVVFHDAYQYFENEFDLRPAGALTVSPDRPPGARRIRQIQRAIAARNVRCVFSEPQFQPRLAAALAADAVAGVLDPLGAELKPGPEAWFELMRGLADALAECLERASQP